MAPACLLKSLLKTSGYLNKESSDDATCFSEGAAHRKSTLLNFPAKSSHKIYDQTDDENQANAAAADYRTTKVKSPAAEQQEQYKQN